MARPHSSHRSAGRALLRPGHSALGGAGAFCGQFGQTLLALGEGEEGGTAAVEQSHIKPPFSGLIGLGENNERAFKVVAISAISLRFYTSMGLPKLTI